MERGEKRGRGGGRGKGRVGGLGSDQHEGEFAESEVMSVSAMLSPSLERNAAISLRQASDSRVETHWPVSQLA